tara:strand:- start:274 stop:477 length:204 start_codon:yes stop_codon:yes gene_type:complete
MNEDSTSLTKENLEKIDSSKWKKWSTTIERSDFADDGKDSAPSAEKENTSPKSGGEPAAEAKETPEQ